MRPSIAEVDIARLSPTQKMELADVLYDIAQQEIETTGELLTPQQLAEVERRVAAADAGAIISEPWDIVYTRLRQAL